MSSRSRRGQSRRRTRPPRSRTDAVRSRGRRRRRTAEGDLASSSGSSSADSARPHVGVSRRISQTRSSGQASRTRGRGRARRRVRGRAVRATDSSARSRLAAFSTATSSSAPPRRRQSSNSSSPPRSGSGSSTIVSESFHPSSTNSLHAHDLLAVPSAGGPIYLFVIQAESGSTYSLLELPEVTSPSSLITSSTPHPTLPRSLLLGSSSPPTSLLHFSIDPSLSSSLPPISVLKAAGRVTSLLAVGPTEAKPAGRLVLAFGSRLGIWNLESGRMMGWILGRRKTMASPDVIRCLAEWGSEVYVAGDGESEGSSCCCVVDPNSGKPMRCFEGLKGQVTSLCEGQKGGSVTMGMKDGSLACYPFERTVDSKFFAWYGRDLTGQKTIPVSVVSLCSNTAQDEGIYVVGRESTISVCTIRIEESVEEVAFTKVECEREMNAPILGISKMVFEGEEIAVVVTARGIYGWNPYRADSLAFADSVPFVFDFEFTEEKNLLGEAHLLKGSGIYYPPQEAEPETETEPEAEVEVSVVASPSENQDQGIGATFQVEEEEGEGEVITSADDVEWHPASYVEEPDLYTDNPLAVVALGSSAIVSRDRPPSIDVLMDNAYETCSSLLPLIQSGSDIVITYDTCPQVSNETQKNEAGSRVFGDNCPAFPFHVIGAETQASLGFVIESQLRRILLENGIVKNVVTIVTQVLVDSEHESFNSPTEMVGPTYSTDEADLLGDIYRWAFCQARGGRWRRAVPSPPPVQILNSPIINQLAREGNIVICLGGGGVPMYEHSSGVLVGVDAIIDKDAVSSKLAQEMRADELIILTSVSNVCVHLSTPWEEDLEDISLEQATRFLIEGQFGKGSMKPKMESVIDFVKNSESPDARAIVTSSVAWKRGKKGTIVAKN